jgi:hypothetical protein
MKHTIYEDPVTHKFALVKLPEKFIEGDKLPIPHNTQWVTTREDAVAALRGLFEVDENEDEKH